MAHLAALNNLSHLAIGGSQHITLGCLNHFLGMNHLTDLSLEDIDFTLPNAQTLARNIPSLNQVTSRLTSLSLRGAINDLHLLLLGQMLDLRQLRTLKIVSSSTLTDGGLGRLDPLVPQLERFELSLTLRNPNFISERAVTHLLQLNPMLDASKILRSETLL